MTFTQTVPQRLTFTTWDYYLYVSMSFGCCISSSSPSLMIFLAAMADDRWMGSMKMLAASEPEIMENLDSEAMEKLKRKLRNNHLKKKTPKLQHQKPFGACMQIILANCNPPFCKRKFRVASKYSCSVKIPVPILSTGVWVKIQPEARGWISNVMEVSYVGEGQRR